MANFKEFKDLHDFNRPLNEDDWNSGQQFVFKLKNSMKNDKGKCDFATSLKIAHSQPGENHVVKLEEKITSTGTEFGGLNMEVKATNDGKIAFKNEMNGLFKDFEGLENSAVTTEGTISAKDGLKWDAGLRHCGKDHHFQIASQLKASPKITTSTVWRPCQWFVVGEKLEMNTSMTDTKFEVKSTIGFPGATGVNFGSWIKGTHASGMTFNNLSSGGSLVHASGNNTAGFEADIDFQSKAVKTLIGFQNKQDDHTWKFMAHSSGMARALLKWQLHKCCSASINTAIDLGDIPSGKVSPLPWGCGFTVKY